MILYFFHIHWTFILRVLFLHLYWLTAFHHTVCLEIISSRQYSHYPILITDCICHQRRQLAIKGKKNKNMRPDLTPYSIPLLPIYWKVKARLWTEKLHPGIDIDVESESKNMRQNVSVYVKNGIENSCQSASKKALQ